MKLHVKMQKLRDYKTLKLRGELNVERNSKLRPIRIPVDHNVAITMFLYGNLYIIVII